MLLTLPQWHPSPCSPPPFPNPLSHMTTMLRGWSKILKDKYQDVDGESVPYHEGGALTVSQQSATVGDGYRQDSTPARSDGIAG